MKPLIARERKTWISAVVADSWLCRQSQAGRAEAHGRSPVATIDSRETTLELITMTGASGRIASALRPLLAADSRRLRLVDVVEPDVEPGDGEEFTALSITDLDGMVRACAGAQALIHLGADASEREWPELDQTNITGTYVALESARQAGVRTVFLASSLHAAGFETIARANRSPMPKARPDTLYGFTKAAAEALGSLYADRFGMTVIAARIMEFHDQPKDERGRWLWLSPADAGRLVEASIQLEEPGFHVVWGVSRNRWSDAALDPGTRIGFRPEDVADKHLDAVASSEEVDPERELLAGTFIDERHRIGEDWTRTVE